MKKQRHCDPKVEQLLDELMQDYSSPEQILGEEGLIKQLSKRLIEKALQAALTHHLQSSPEGESPSPSKSGNSRNGYSAKTINTEQGAFGDCPEFCVSGLESYKQRRPHHAPQEKRTEPRR